MKILISCRDFGAATQLYGFLHMCKKIIHDFNFLVIVQEPSNKIMAEFADIKLPASSTETFLVVKNAFDIFQPDFCLVGLSGHGWGVDETLLSYAKTCGVLTGTIQDYWGYTGTKDSSVYADYYFVLDKLAVELTTPKIPNTSKSIIIGSPKHEYLSAAIRQKRPAKKSKKTITFYLQPAWMPGVLQNFSTFISITNTLDKKAFDVEIRPHPSDRNNVSVRKLIGKSRLNIRLQKSEEYWQSLLNSDFVCTCFSSAGIDLKFAQQITKDTSGTLIYFWVGKDIKTSMLEAIGSRQTPLLDKSWDHVLESHLTARAKFKKALKKPKRLHRLYETKMPVLHGASVSLASQIKLSTEKSKRNIL